MIKLFMVFAFALLAACIPAFAQSPISDNVVINEVDINPRGDDATALYEWVELYNPTNSTINISGWTVASTSVLQKTLFITESTFLNPGELRAFPYTKVWFADVNEVVQLRDRSGMIVDQTPELTDLDDDLFSWQRIYDGYDTDSVSDWIFEASSAGRTNGKFQAQQDDDGGVQITLTTDKSEYTFGEYVTISGDVSKKIFTEKPIFGAATIHVLVQGQNYSREFTLYPDLSLNYDVNISLQKVLGIDAGVYDVSVEYAGATAQTRFSVDVPIISVEEEQSSELSISFDQSSYIPGQTATISAQTSEISAFEGLKFTVLDPNGAQIFDGTLYPNGDGEFSTSIYMTTVSPVFGTHTITANYGENSAESSFELLEEVLENKLISLFTEESVYGLGDTVVVTGRLNNFWIFSLDLEIQQVGSTALDFEPGKFYKDLGSVRLAGDSTFRHEFDIPNNPDRYGEYRIKVSKDLGSEEIFFKVVENPDTYVPGEDVAMTVYTDKDSYPQGSKFTISGKINDLQTSSSFYTKAVEIKITKSDGSQVTSGIIKPTHEVTEATYTLTAIPDIGGNYLVEDTLYASIYDGGTYVIDASYADGTHTASNTFSIVDSAEIQGSLQLNINKEIFGLNEEVIVEGLVPGLFQGSGIDITLFKPDGDTDEFGRLVDNSKFIWTWKTPIAEKTQTVFNDRDDILTNYGVYRVSFSTDSETRHVFFKVSPHPESDSLNVLPIEVTTDKPVYNAGDDIVISGVAQKRAQGMEGLVVEERAQVVVKPTVAPFNELYSAFLHLDNGGNFETKFNLPVTLFDDGTYKITAIYQNQRAETIFTVDNEFQYGGDEELSLILNTDKDEYNPGDSVQITGRLNKLIYLEKVDITIVREDDTRITCGSFVCGTTGTTVTVVPSASGAFNYVHMLASDDSAKGNYEILADTEFGTYHLAFNVTDATIKEPSSAPQIRTTEKFNRIADSVIPITVDEIIQEKTLVPRTLQGSLFTSARGEESSVNIRLASGDGTCVIGPADECLVSESTRVPGEIYKIVEIEGREYKVRYSGTDARLEKFTILPAGDGTIHISEWDVEILKDDQPSKFYYKITRISQE